MSLLPKPQVSPAALSGQDFLFGFAPASASTGSQRRGRHEAVGAYVHAAGRAEPSPATDPHELEAAGALTMQSGRFIFVTGRILIESLCAVGRRRYRPSRPHGYRGK